MNISIISINYFPEPTGISVYSTGLAEYLVVAGHAVTVYTAFAYYPAWKKSGDDAGRIFLEESLNGVAVKRNYIYVPSKPTALLRILHEFSFCVSSACRYLTGPAAQLTIVVSPPLLLGALFGILAKLKRSKVALHIQDLQPDAAIDLGMLRPGLLASLLFRLEGWAYHLANQVSTISDSMRRKIEAKGVDPAKCLIFKNWADDDLIKPTRPEDSLRRSWGLDHMFVALYSGNMGVKQGLGMMLEAAVRLKDDEQIIFLIVGDGGEKEALMERCSVDNLSNVRFIPPVPRELLSQLLATADVSVITQKAGVDDLVLPSKLANLLSSARPVIASSMHGSELASIINAAQCGLVVPPEDGIALANSLATLRSDPNRREQMGANGREYAVRYLGSHAILSEFEQTLTRLVQ